MSKNNNPYEGRTPCRTVLEQAEGGITIEFNVYCIAEEDMPLEQRRALNRLRQVLVEGQRVDHLPSVDHAEK